MYVIGWGNGGVETFGVRMFDKCTNEWSRVQQIVGATHNMHRCSGNALPPPIDESFNCNSPSIEKPICRSLSKGVTPDIATSGVHATYLPLCKDEDGDARAASKITTFVDIVGRSCSNGMEKDGNVTEDRGVENLMLTGCCQRVVCGGSANVYLSEIREAGGQGCVFKERRYPPDNQVCYCDIC